MDIAMMETDHLLASPTDNRDRVDRTNYSNVPLGNRSGIRDYIGGINHPKDDDGSSPPPSSPSGGTSSVVGCAINVTNAIMGAGCIGYGGVMASSGGFITILLITIFAILTKFSFDLLIELVLLLPEQNSSNSHTLPSTTTSNLSKTKDSSSSSSPLTTASYEALANQTYGRLGLVSLMCSKGLYSFGCMVAYIVIIHDNLASGCRGLQDLLSSSSGANETGTKQLLSNDLGVTLVVSFIVIFPLSLLRNVSHLERFSSTKIVLYVIILAIVIYMYFTLPAQEKDDEMSFYEKWWQIKPSVLQNMGTLVFSFEAVQNVHTCFRSLHPPQRTLQSWGTVASLSIGTSYVVFLGLALFGYMTYWNETTSDLFLQYPQDEPMVCLARILLSISMFFIYPMPMFAIREIIVLSIPRTLRRMDASGGTDMTEDTLYEEETIPSNDAESLESSLSWPQHFVLTFVLVALSLILAISAGSLGQVLNLIGCVSATLVSFILPAIFSFQIQGVTYLGILFLVVGSFVGIVGTWFSVRDLLFL